MATAFSADANPRHQDKQAELFCELTRNEIATIAKAQDWDTAQLVDDFYDVASTDPTAFKTFTRDNVFEFLDCATRVKCNFMDCVGRARDVAGLNERIVQEEDAATISDVVYIMCAIAVPDRRPTEPTSAYLDLESILNLTPEPEPTKKRSRDEADQPGDSAPDRTFETSAKQAKKTDEDEDASQEGSE